MPVRVDRRGPVTEVTLANPPLNLLTAELRARLVDVAEFIKADGGVRAVVLRGEGQGFSAGSDVREFPTDAEAGQQRARAEHRCVHAIEELPQPVVVALHGHVLGGGLELALAGDVRIAEESARIGLPETDVGVFPSGGGATRLPRIVGAAKAKELMFLGSVLNGARAAELGVVQQLATEGGAAAAADDLARRIAARPARAVRAIKAVVDTGPGQPTAAGEQVEADRIAEVFTSEDAREGVVAFLEKREPQFRHR